MLRRLIDRLGPFDDTLVIDEAHTLVSRVLALAPDERAAVLRVFVFAGVIDGRLARRERELIRELRQQLGLPGDVSDVERLRRDLVEGRPLTLA